MAVFDNCPTQYLIFLENYGNLHHKCCIFISSKYGYEGDTTLLKGYSGEESAKSTAAHLPGVLLDLGLHAAHYAGPPVGHSTGAGAGHIGGGGGGHPGH